MLHEERWAQCRTSCDGSLHMYVVGSLNKAHHCHALMCFVLAGAALSAVSQDTGRQSVTGHHSTAWVGPMHNGRGPFD